MSPGADASLMTVSAVLLGIALLSFVLAIIGNLSRIADAIEAQNRAYGIAGDAEKKKEGAA